MEVSVVKLVGTRCLLKLAGSWGGSVEEYKVLELSPSKNWVKLMNMYGNKFWKPIQDVSLVEELYDLRTHKVGE